MAAITGSDASQATDELKERLENASPYFLALVEDEAPSELDQARGRLSRLTVNVVEHLTLKVRVRAVLPEELFAAEDAYLKQTTLSGAGPIRRALGTYYCAEAAARDSYPLGSAIADFLQIYAKSATLADGADAYRA